MTELYSPAVNDNYGDSVLRYAPSFLDQKQSTKFHRMLGLANALMPSQWVPEYEAWAILERAYQAVDREYGIEEANTWANHFKFPPEVAWMDMVALGEEGWSLSKLARKKNLNLIGERFSTERLTELWDPEDPDYPHLLELSQRVPVWTDTSSFMAR